MIEITDISQFSSHKGTVVTIGTFDGVHLGHQKIIKKLVEFAKKNDLLATIFTFFPHPRTVVQHDDDLKLIQTLSEKKNVLQSLGIDLLIVCPFNESFSKISAEEFVRELLVNRLNVKRVIIGYDHRFGYNRSANIDDMKRFGEKYNFEVEEIPAQEINDISVSSTKIRIALNQGNVETAWKYLGSPFSINGKVVHGLKIGRTIGFPTANIQIEETYKIIPKDGIYLVFSIFENKKVYGMMSIGKNPTIEGKGKTIEVHFFDFQKDIYGHFIQIYFLTYLRDEKKFESVSELQKQLKKDEIISKSIINKL